MISTRYFFVNFSALFFLCGCPARSEQPLLPLKNPVQVVEFKSLLTGSWKATQYAVTNVSPLMQSMMQIDRVRFDQTGEVRIYREAAADCVPSVFDFIYQDRKVSILKESKEIISLTIIEMNESSVIVRHFFSTESYLDLRFEKQAE
jgi:hypothetical protein